jgi:ParB family chromosome partitioning protein
MMKLPFAVVRPVEESEAQLVARCRKALARSDKSSWEVADCYELLSRRGWTGQRIAKEFNVSSQKVCRFLACVSLFPLMENRPSFWEAFQEVTGRAVHISQNTGIPEWYTPPEFIEAARQVLGKIDLDPATSAIAQRTVKARYYFTKDDDGLSKAWQGRVWLNPPYAADLVGRFVGKLCDHYEAGDVVAAIQLVNNATETTWFQRAAGLAGAFCFPAGRIKFLDEEGNPGAPLQGQVLLYFGEEVRPFVAAFSPFGESVARSRGTTGSS